MIKKISMSAPASIRPQPLSDGKAVAEGENKVAMAVSADDRSSRILPNSSNEASSGVSNGDKVKSSISVGATGPLLPQEAAPDQQLDAASTALSGSEAENKPTRSSSRTRAHSQNNRTGEKQNGDKTYQEQVSYSS